MSSRLKPESILSREVREGLETAFPGSLWLKIHGNKYQQSGISDLLGCVDGVFVAIELKMWGNQLTALQRDFLVRVRESGGLSVTHIMLVDESYKESARRLVERLQTRLQTLREQENNEVPSPVTH